MLTDLILDTLKLIVGLLLRLSIAFFTWNYAIAPIIGLPKLTFITIIFIYIFISALSSDFIFEKVVAYNEDENEET